MMHFTNTTLRQSMMAVLIFTACGEGAATGDQVEATSAADEQELVSGTRIDRSLAVTDPAILAKFGFARTIDAVRKTALGTGQAFPATESRTTTFRRWMRSFGTGPEGCNRAGIDPNHYGLKCPRTAEAKLATIDPFAANAPTFVPVGLFNRFDLAPANGASCGEYRIVYALKLPTTVPSPVGGRAFIIFEASLPNPAPTKGLAGCLPIAKFWQGLTNDADVNSRAAKLEKFYYLGTAVAGVGPVVSAANYGFVTGTTVVRAGRPGQVRTNFFIDGAEWQLREFKLQRTCPTATTCQLLFNHVPAKANPAEELFAGTHANSAAFRTAFLNQVPTLVRPTLPGIGASFADTFNTFESNSQEFPSKLKFKDFDDATIRSQLQAKLTSLGSTLSVDNVLDRATTQTCGGCHQVSPGQALGGGLTWPNSLNFVHIDETRALSPALTQVFLPARRQVLERFINAPPLAAAALAVDNLGVAPTEELTISGQPVGSPN